MHKLLTILNGASVNILGFVTMDSAEFGTARILVSDTEKAMRLLTEKEYLVRKSSVIGIELEDRPGELDKVLCLIGDMNININYMYLGFRRENSMPITIINTDHLDVVSDMLKRKGYTVY